MNLLNLLCVLCVTFTGLCEGSGVLVDDLLNAPVGGKVLFTAKLTPQDPPVTFSVVIWSFETLRIITSIPHVNKTELGYENRITLFISTGSLELRNLALHDSGEYGVDIVTSGGVPQPGNTRLMIYETVSNVMITTSSTDLVEFISSVHLSCSSSGSSLSFLWLNGSSEVKANDRVQLTGHNLTIFNVTRYDEGTFRCRVLNPVSNGTSDPVFLSVSFGPENTRLNLSPSEHYYEDGSNVNLTCSAVSRPPAHFQWIGLSVSGPELPLLNLNMKQTGIYSCQAFNNKTKRSQTSQPAFISVLFKRPPSCSSGCINGIKFACCLVVGLCAGGWYFVSRRRKQRKSLSHGDTRTGSTGGGIQNSVASSSNQDVTYENIDSLRNQDVGTVQLELERISSS